jgi:hypothetical protein
LRRIIHVPIVHSQTDMGPIEEQIRQAYVEKGGEEAWRASRQAVAQFWAAIEEVMDRLLLDYSKVRIYQDGLPVCGQEVRIVGDLARQGGPNYKILLKLAERGATIEGTEHPDLLRREYELVMNSSFGPGRGAEQADGAETAEVFRDLLERRDRFIARRIEETLQPDETGILFLGALHRATTMLPSTVEVVSLKELLRTECGSA